MIDWAKRPERERERERERARERERERAREREREKREREREGEKEGERERKRETERDRERQGETGRANERERESARKYKYQKEVSTLKQETSPLIKPHITCSAQRSNTNPTFEGGADTLQEQFESRMESGPQNMTLRSHVPFTCIHAYIHTYIHTCEHMPVSECVFHVLHMQQRAHS